MRTPARKEHERKGGDGMELEWRVERIVCRKVGSRQRGMAPSV